MSNIFTYETGWLKGKNGTTGNYKYTCTINLNSQSVENNTSNITVTMTLVGESNSGTTMWSADATKNQPYGTLTGSVSATGSRISVWKKTTTPTTIVTWTGNIQHDDDGTKTISVAFNWVAGGLNFYPATQTFTTANVALTTIARASTLTFSTVTIGNTTGSLPYTITSRANFYHKLEWALGTGSGTLLNGTNINKTTYTGTIPYTTLLSALPAAASGTLTFTLKTYSDSGMTNLIGTKTTTGTVAVNTGAIKPTVTITSVAVATTPIAGIYVAGYSTAQLNYTTVNSYAASGLTNTFATSRGSMATASTTTVGSGNVLTNAFPSSATDYTATLTANSTDSRGAKATQASTTVTVRGYSAPVITATVSRCDAGGTADEAGAYAVATFSATCSLSAEGNTVSVSATMNGSPITSGTVYSLAEENSATFTFTATDLVTTSTVTKTVPSANFPLDLYDDGNGHIGVGIGKVAEADKMIINMPVDLRSTMTATGNITGASLYAGDAADTTERRVRVDSGAGGIYMYSQASGTGNRGIYLPAHGTGSAKAAINVDTNNNVTLNGNAATATTASYTNQVNSYPSARPASPDISNNAARMYHFLASGSMTTNKPANDGQIISMEWDNTNILGSQLFLCHTNGQHNALGWRGSNNTTWHQWAYADLRRQLWTGTTAGQGSKSISLNVSGYSYLKIWAHCYDVCFNFDLDLTTVPSYTIAGATGNTAYRGSGVAPLYTTGASSVRMEQYFCMVEVNSAKTTLTVVQIGYFRGSGTYEARLNNAAYYIYKIEGYM